MESTYDSDNRQLNAPVADNDAEAELPIDHEMAVKLDDLFVRFREWRRSLDADISKFMEGGTMSTSPVEPETVAPSALK